MDYTHSSNFFPGAPPYQFMGAQVAPLTPSHSNSVASEDFNTTSPPVGCVSSLPEPRHAETRRSERRRSPVSRRLFKHYLFSIGSHTSGHFSCPAWLPPVAGGDSAFCLP